MMQQSVLFKSGLSIMDLMVQRPSTLIKTHAKGSSKHGKARQCHTPTPRQPQAQINTDLRDSIRTTQGRGLNRTPAQRVAVSPLQPPVPAVRQTAHDSTPSASSDINRTAIQTTDG
ncbi:hypothetical protein PF003_g23739 [Phytophthora fragariae]|nr:hypothetical protein PF003_g23739 [Phytophthora fragariae]